MRHALSREFFAKASPSPTKSSPATPRWTRPSRKPASGFPKGAISNSSDSTKAASSAASRRTWRRSAPSRPSARHPWNRHLKKQTFSANLLKVERKKPSPRSSFCRCRDLIFQPPTSPVSSCAAATSAKPESGSRTRASRQKSPHKWRRLLARALFDGKRSRSPVQVSSCSPKCFQSQRLSLRLRVSASKRSLQRPRRYPSRSPGTLSLTGAIAGKSVNGSD